MQGAMNMKEQYTVVGFMPPEFCFAIGGVAVMSMAEANPATDAVQTSLDRRGQGGPAQPSK